MVTELSARLPDMIGEERDKFVGPMIYPFGKPTGPIQSRVIVEYGESRPLPKSAGLPGELWNGVISVNI